MVATSPVRHEPPPSLQLAPIEVHQCHQASPWKALSDFALQADLDQPPFQQLVSSFGESSGEDDDNDSTVVCVDEPPAAGTTRVGGGGPPLQRRAGPRTSVPFQPPFPPPLPPVPHSQPLVAAQFGLNALC